MDIDRLIAVVRAATQGRACHPQAADRPCAPLRPRSAGERWALHVLRACESESDLKTLEDWATFVGVSYTSLCERCGLVGIRPHDARDLSRMRRAVLKASVEGCRLDVLLDIGDRRTLNALLTRAGLGNGASTRHVSLQAFLDGQRFVPADNEGFVLLRQVLAARAHGAARAEVATTRAIDDRLPSAGAKS